MAHYVLKREEESEPMDWRKVDEVLASAALPCSEEATVIAHKKRHVFPGAVLLVGLGGNVVYHKAAGCRSIVPNVSPMHEDTVFDVASLTKAMVTTTLIMQLIDRGLLSIDRRVSRILQTFGTHGKERITIRHLLNHTSGYPALAPFFKQIARLDSGSRTGMMVSRGAAEAVYTCIYRSKIENLPGKVTKYSDIGFMLLGHIIESIENGTSLDKLAAKNIFQPLGMKSTGFIDLSLVKQRRYSVAREVIAPTAECPWRGKILCGEVHDDNAWAMGGVAGHAGVFSTAHDVHLFAKELLSCYHGRGSLVSQETMRRFWTADLMDPKSTWALGWDTPSLEASSSGHHFSAESVGHLGFSGCSLWIDPKREVDVVLLSNRIHPTPENNLIREFRPVIHDVVMETLGFAS